jgi:aspartyl-tRNA(Asn)/glutamyl-tRNA(Gln) amidotransferase subunit B
LEGAVGYEIQRQHDEWLADPEGYSLERMGKQNRGWDDARNQTVFQREKEEAHDYRYFPEPDLVPVTVDDSWRESIRSAIGELPLARRARYMKGYALTFKEADALTQDAPTGDLLDSALGAGADAKRCVNLLLGRGAAIANERGCTIAEVGVDARQLAELAKMLAAGEVNATAAAKVFDALVREGGSPKEIAKAQGLLSITDAGAIERWVDEAVAGNPDAVAEVRSGGKKAKKAFSFLMGRVMQQSKGAAQPARVRQLLQKKLGG